MNYNFSIVFKSNEYNMVYRYNNRSYINAVFRYNICYHNVNIERKILNNEKYIKGEAPFHLNNTILSTNSKDK